VQTLTSESLKTVTVNIAYIRVGSKRGEGIFDLGREYVFSLKTLRQKKVFC